MCTIDAKKLYLHEQNAADSPEAIIAGQIDEGVYVQTCMQAHGYRFIGDSSERKGCPKLKGGDQMMLRSEWARCYEPAGWGARQVYNLEVWLD
jgi:hypothetical protein